MWAALEDSRAARFPYPPQGRIPNFAGARRAAERLLAHRRLAAARRVKVNPDAPQRPLREALLARGVVLFVPTPRLRDGFLRFDPARIAARDLRAAASLSRGRPFAEPVPVRELPEMDVIVAGSVAVTLDGRRLGKGHGYSDLEYAILRELGHPPAPVATTVHELQVVDSIPLAPNDLPLSIIATPERLVDVARPPPAPAGIDWDLLSEAALDAMPVLRALR